MVSKRARFALPERPGMTRFVNHIRPSLLSAETVCGSPLDTLGFTGVRAVLAMGEPFGQTCQINWGLADSDTPRGPFETFRDGVLYYGTQSACGLSWLCVRLGEQAGRGRYLRAELSVSGPSLIVAGVTLEFYGGDPRPIGARRIAAGGLNRLRQAPDGGLPEPPG